MNNKRIKIDYRFILLIIYIVVFSGCLSPDIKTVDGPEVSNLLQSISGNILINNLREGISAISIPSLSQTTIYSSQNIIHDLSGPDRKGQILFIEEFNKEFSLKRISIHNSKEKTIFRRIGDHEIGRLCLSPVSDLVVFTSKLRTIHMKVEPKTRFEEGIMELWDIQKDESLKIEDKILALNDSFSWFPDGKMFVYSSLVAPDKLNKSFYQAYDDVLHRGFCVPLADGRIPVIFTYKIGSGEITPIHIGRNPVLRSDGQCILFQSIGDEWILYDFSKKKSQLIEWPGTYGGGYLSGKDVIAFFENDLILYWGLQTKGSEPKFTENNSPFIGKKQMATLKLANYKTKSFQTVIPYIDPRRKVSFGEN